MASYGNLREAVRERNFQGLRLQCSVLFLTLPLQGPDQKLRCLRDSAGLDEHVCYCTLIQGFALAQQHSSKLQGTARIAGDGRLQDARPVDVRRTCLVEVRTDFCSLVCFQEPHDDLPVAFTFQVDLHRHFRVVDLCFEF